ncbi:DNA circularization N-terminal domain-containing protein [Brevibacillus centrosporus]|uniref:DNA circularization N-terminal domain-containing protein n=1 Tax=Brevibacillus centrosporus TaxID=54910 RepID=UPI002E1D7A58|nr:DNA circularization N-terminal domain-containing protein [Brevibacillus centrosporus]
MKWPYNPEQISFSSTKLIVEHEYPRRQGAETEDMGRKSVRVDVRGMFLQNPAVTSPSPIILMNNLWMLHETGAIGKVFGSELGTAVDGRQFRIIDLKGDREPGTVGDIPYSFTFLEHYVPQKSSAAESGAVYSAAPPSSGVMSTTMSKSSAQTRDIVYIVKKGDTLWDIAKDKYHDATKYKQIMIDNKVTVADMVPGLKLTLKGVPVRG